MKFVFALFLVIAMFAVSSEASIGKVASWPARHPKRSAHHLKHAAKKAGHGVKHLAHGAKKVLY